MNRDELFDKHLRGETSPVEAAELKKLLADDAEAGCAFVEHVRETTLLIRVGSQFQSARAAGNVVPLLSEAEPNTLPQRRRWRWAALAASLVALGVLAFVLTRQPAPPFPEVYVKGAGVQVTRAGVQIAGDAIELQAGDVITTPTNGNAVIAYEREATRIEIHSASIVLFGSALHGKRLELRRGIVEARVAPQPAGQPMCIKTAQVRATVLGTSFVMRADENGTRLDVLEGKVEWGCRMSGKKVVIKAGFSASSNPKAPFSVTPLCNSNCILRECRGTNSISTTGFLNLGSFNEK